MKSERSLEQVLLESFERSVICSSLHCYDRFVLMMLFLPGHKEIRWIGELTTFIRTIDCMPI